MNPNARHVIDTPPRTKLVAFADECPEVVEALAAATIALKMLKQHELAARLAALLARMAGEEPPR